MNGPVALSESVALAWTIGSPGPSGKMHENVIVVLVEIVGPSWNANAPQVVPVPMTVSAPGSLIEKT